MYKLRDKGAGLRGRQTSARDVIQQSDPYVVNSIGTEIFEKKINNFVKIICLIYLILTENKIKGENTSESNSREETRQL
jgi:hypothetical protein